MGLKNTYLIVLLCCVSAFLAAQNTLIAQSIEKPAEFRSGLSALNRYFYSHLRLPRAMQRLSMKTDLNGIAEFTIDTFGSVVDIRITKNISPEIDAEILRVLRGMPKWKPAIKSGVKVPMPFIFPYNYGYIRNSVVPIPLDEADELPYKWGFGVAISGGWGFQNKDLGSILGSSFPILNIGLEIDYQRFMFGLGMDGSSMRNEIPVLLGGRLWQDRQDVFGGSFDFSFGYHLLNEKRFKLTPIIATKFNFLSITEDLDQYDNPSYEATAKSLEFSLQSEWFFARSATITNGYTDLMRWGLRSRLSFRPVVYKAKTDKNIRMAGNIVQLTIGIGLSGKAVKNK